MTRGGWLLLVAVIAAASTSAAQSPPDGQRSAWRYRRDVSLPPSADGALLAVPLPPEVEARSQPALRDVRLVDAAGRDIPFLVHDDAPRRVEHRWSGALTEAQRERRDYSTWTVDFGSAITADRIELDLPLRDFAKRFAVDVSMDGVAWRELGRDYWVFDRVWQSSRVHDTAIDIPAGELRFVRLQADDANSAPVALRGVTAVRADDLAGESWSEVIALELMSADGGRARYRVGLPDGHPVRRLEVEADDPAFARTVTVLERTRDGERTAGSGLAYRLRLPGAAAVMEARGIDVAREAAGPLVVEIANGDNPALQNPRIRVSAPRKMLLTAPGAGSATLYYGNPVTRAPVYDLEQFRLTLASVPDYPQATLGPEVENPSFRAPAPLAFVASRGAAVDPGDWRFSRALVVDGRDALYTVTLAPADLSRLRPDLGDLRLVDESARQVPYVLEPGATTSAVNLDVSPGRARGNRARVSAYRLAPTAIDRGAGPLHVSALRLQVAEPFFQRAVVVVRPEAEAPLGGSPVGTATLVSRPRAGDTGPVWVQLPLGGVRATELVLEVEDGDNAPLTVLRAQGVVPVPRITFKAAPGAYRLLMGHADARPPSYELDLLRQEVLAYSAVPLEADAAPMAAENPDFRRDVADLIREAPPRAVLWTALALAVVVLLVLTRRILTRSSPPGV